MLITHELNPQLPIWKKDVSWEHSYLLSEEINETINTVN